MAILIGSFLFHLIEKYIEGRKNRWELPPHLVEWREMCKEDMEEK